MVANAERMSHALGRLGPGNVHAVVVPKGCAAVRRREARPHPAPQDLPRLHLPFSADVTMSEWVRSEGGGFRDILQGEATARLRGNAGVIAGRPDELVVRAPIAEHGP